MPDPVRSLEAHRYTDPAIFAAERAGTLARTWQFACHVSHLKAPGDYFTFEVAGESLFSITGSDGLTRAFYNVCQHRTECNNPDQMAYGINSGFANNDKYSSWFLWPMFSFQVYPGNPLNTYHWLPQEVDKVVVWRGWYTASGEETATVRQMAVQDLETTVAEDIRLVESVQRGLGARGYRPGPLVVDPDCGANSEHSIMHLQQWMREAMDD